MAAGAEPFAAMAIRSGLAVICFSALLAAPDVRRQMGAFRAADLRLSVVSAFFGTALGMSLLMGALKAGNVGVVSTLSSMTPVLIRRWCGFEAGACLSHRPGAAPCSPSWARP